MKTKPKLSKKLRLLVDEYSSCAKAVMLEEERGSPASHTRAMENYADAGNALIKQLAFLEKKNKLCNQYMQKYRVR